MTRRDDSVGGELGPGRSSRTDEEVLEVATSLTAASRAQPPPSATEGRNRGVEAACAPLHAAHALTAVDLQPVSGDPLEQPDGLAANRAVARTIANILFQHERRLLDAHLRQTQANRPRRPK